MIKALGGCGEDARNCFYVEDRAGRYLFDCGVKREIGPVDEVYPLIDTSLAKSLDAVFLSHAHEDHSAGLAYLYELGYRGPVYGSKETVGLVKGFINKWVGYVQDHDGFLPFDKRNIDSIDFRPIEEASSLPVVWGRSAHMTGSLWFKLESSFGTVAYTGDLCLDSLLLQNDPMGACDYLIVDSAYADRSISQALQYEKLYETVKSVKEKGGLSLLPVPANGRGIDILLYLRRRNIGLCVDKKIIANAQSLFAKKAWIKDSPLWSCLDVDGDEACAYLCSDGMMTTKSSMDYYDALKSSDKNAVILTGHMAKGTMGHEVENGLLGDPVQSFSITIKVHPDRDDVVSIVQACKPKAVMLFHSLERDCQDLCRSIEDSGIRATCKPLDSLSL